LFIRGLEWLLSNRYYILKISNHQLRQGVSVRESREKVSSLAVSRLREVEWQTLRRDHLEKYNQNLCLRGFTVCGDILELANRQRPPAVIEWCHQIDAMRTKSFIANKLRAGMLILRTVIADCIKKNMQGTDVIKRKACKGYCLIMKRNEMIKWVDDLMTGYWWSSCIPPVNKLIIVKHW
jgi:hypothetical protein